MADTKRHIAMESDSVDILHPSYKRQKLEATLSDVESKQALPEAPIISTDGLERTKETMYGITEFVSTNLLGFSGILKQRYTDFQVNEILPSGEVVHITNLRAPKREQKHEPFNGITSAAANGSQSQSHVGLLEQKSGTVKQATVDQTPEGVSTRSKQEEPSTYPEQIFQSMKQQANEDDAGPSLPSVKQDETDTDTHLDATQPKTDPSLPLPKSDVDQPERVSPHKRVLATSSPTPSMQDHESQQLGTPTRKKNKVTIRQTSRGWEEVDPEQEEELAKKATENARVQRDKSPPENSVKEQAQPAEVRYAPKSSTLAQWQAFADANSPPKNPVKKEAQPAEVKRSSLAQWQAFAAANSPGKVATGFQLNGADRGLLTQFLDPATVDALVALYEGIVNSPHHKAKVHGVVRSATMSRERRSRIHQEIRRIFNSRLESVTDNAGSIVITAMAEKPTFHARTPVNNGRDRGSNQKQWTKPTWEELGGDYLHFTLYKENRDTMECISWLAKELKIKPNSFQFAGTKDRRAVTVQRVSVYRVLADRMISAGSTLRNAKVGDFEYRPFALQLGELSGNEFVVTLRDCDFHYPMPMDCKTISEGARSIVGAAIKSLSERGFVNYYGLQRFGTFSTSTSEVGLRLLQGDFKAAVDAILHFAPASLMAALMAAQDPTSTTDRVSRDDQARAYVIHTFNTAGNVNLHAMPQKFSAELSVLRHLTKKEQSHDYIGALQTIQRNLRLMYVHAYQSMVWNVAASERWKRFGAAVIEGDLVLIDEHTDKTEAIIKKEYVDADGEAIVHASAQDRAADPDDMFIRARALSKEEAESGSYTIFDIVLPTPGYDILYPANELETFYEEFMASERGGGLDPHEMRRTWKDISLSGSYRKLLAKPGKNTSFEIRVYEDDDEQFVETDMDRFGYGSHGNIINGQTVPLKALSTHMRPKIQGDKTLDDSLTSPKSELSDTETGGVRLSGGLYKDFKIAAILKFQLGTSQYATIALRELMKLGVNVYKPDFSGGR